MYGVKIDGEQTTAIDELVGELADRYGSVESPDFLDVAGTYAQELPRPLRAALNTFRLTEPDGVCLLSGYPVDDAAIGPTPQHWKLAKDRESTRRHEFFLCLTSSLLGDPIAWATQQSGYVMHDILPIRSHENEQLGSGSAQPLTWHTEDAFHPLRTDYLALMCLRNPDGVRTTLAQVDDVRLDEAISAVLREERFPIQPDRSHLPAQRGGAPLADPGEAALIARTYEWIEALDVRPAKVAVLFGAPDSPYLRLDPYFMPDLVDDPVGQEALSVLVRAIDSAMDGHRLLPGEIIFLDNYKVVHGREAFTARFDGTDRWLKRVNIARDLRKSRAARRTARSRTIY